MMTTEPQPELRWAPIPPKPKNRGRVWLIVGLVAAALVVAAVVALFLIPRGDEPRPGATETSSATPTPAPSDSASPTPPTGTPAPQPTVTPVDTPPPAADPSVDAFRAQVSGWLGDAGRGLDIVAGSSGQDALPVIDTLREDAQRLSDAQPPASIAQDWTDGVSAYAQKLSDLRSAVAAGSGVQGAVDAARSAAQNLNGLVGL